MLYIYIIYGAIKWKVNGMMVLQVDGFNMSSYVPAMLSENLLTNRLTVEGSFQYHWIRTQNEHEIKITKDRHKIFPHDSSDQGWSKYVEMQVVSQPCKLGFPCECNS